uniref:Transglutaminase-like domain-containing protein n=1 Tax=Gracilinema caldarium TaxID=215591 RepID=A0A7C3EJC2_9SPIR
MSAFLPSTHATTPSTLTHACKVATILWIGLGLAVILVLLNVSRRSLAEVWFLMVRKGRARGFFSYFADLVYGFLTTLSAILMVHFGIVSGILALGTVSFLVWAILFGQTLGFLGALILGIFLFIIINVKRFGLGQPKQILTLIRSVSLPFGVVLLCLAPLVPLLDATGTEVSLPGFDITPLALRVVPTLPLLLDVPGYGLDVGVSRFAHRLDLSSVPLFEVQGPPNRLFYLASATYAMRTSEGWVEDTYSQDSRLMNEQTNMGSSPVLRLRFVGEYYDRFPLPARASGVVIRTSASDSPLPPISMGGLQSGIRFASPIEQGTILEAVLAPPVNAVTDGPEVGIQAGDPAEYTNPGPDPSRRISELARQWDPDVLNADTALVLARTIENYLKDQYKYSLRVQDGPRSLALERFLFEEKKGYCLHFASAFVVLLRNLGIPARLVEGFRTQLDAQGRALIRGTDAHAWAEAYIGGLWLRFDPTPSTAATGASPLTAIIPFAGPRPPEDLEGRLPPSADRLVEKGRPFWLFISVLILILLIGAFYTFFVLLEQNRYRKSRLRHYVRLGKRRGIPGPELIGWLQWYKAAVAANLAKDPGELDERIQEHLRHSFGKG